MTATQSGTTSDAQVLPYLINDADEHSTPATGAYEKYIDPDKRDMAIRMSPGGGDDRRQLLYNGRPARFTFKNFQVRGLQRAARRDRREGQRLVRRGSGDPRLAPQPAQPA